jgi:iron(III) transport system substrate-binding protein
MNRLLTIFVVVSLLLPVAASAGDNELVVYSARNEHLIKPLFDSYTEKTGTTIKFVTDKAGPLVERLRSEGKRTEADVLITVDAGNLWYAATQDLLQPVNSPTLEKNIPERLQDPENRWFGLSVRARTIVYNTDRVKPSELSTYEELADPKWNGRLILRTSKKVYNQSLVAMLIAQNGAADTEKLVSGWVGNLATAPLSSDTKVLEAIAAGQGDVGIINTYYFGRLLKKQPDLPLALFWPNQGNTGVHVNISGAGVVKHSRNVKEAVRFIEWLSSGEAQEIFARANMEYPANSSVDPDPFIRTWGDFKPSSMNLAEAGKRQAEAIMLMDRAGYR